MPTQLPTYSDIGKYVAYIKAKENMIRTQFKEKKSGFKNFKNADIFDKVANDIINIHVLASVPCLPKHKIVEKIGKLWDMKADHLKEKASSAKKKKWGKKKTTILEVMDKIFDVVDSKNVPVLEKEFVEDQRNERNMWIEKVDQVVTQKISKVLSIKKS